MNKETKMAYLDKIAKYKRDDIIIRFRRTMKRLRFVDKYALSCGLVIDFMNFDFSQFKS